ncbi:MAG: hypothetical protein ACE15B_06540 [Bryobacteraceae bacterium]
MNRRILRWAAVTVLPATSLLADFTYEQTSRITGGAVAGMMKVAGVFSKSAREPMKTTISVKGDRMVTLSPQRASIIDLASETMTEIDMQRKTYSVITFAQFRQFMEEMARKNKKGEGEVSFKMSVNDTGQTKQIAGFDTRQMIVNMVMETKDPQSGQTVPMNITADMWIAPKMAGYDEVTAFHQKMAQKLGFAPGGNFMMQSPEIAKGMAEVAKEASKLNGMPVMQTIRMGGAQGAAGAESQQAPPPQQEKQAAPSAGSALGGALGGRLGRFGGFGRKKTPEPQQQQQQQPEQPPAQQQGQQQSAPGSLLEMVSELSGFSAAPVEPSKFEVPAGFKQVEDRRGK